MNSTDRVLWMRALGVVEAEWDGEDLVRCRLGPSEVPIEPETPEQAEARVKAAEEARKRLEDIITYGAST